MPITYYEACDLLLSVPCGLPSLHYVLAFPSEDAGWLYTMQLINDIHLQRKKKNVRLTLPHFHRYWLFTRENQFSCLHRLDRLFQQYVVDARYFNIQHTFPNRTFLFMLLFHIVISRNHLSNSSLQSVNCQHSAQCSLKLHRWDM